MRLCAILTLAAATIAFPAHATTHTVDVNGTGDFIAIGPAVQASSEGDTILVLPGTYTGDDNESIAGSHSENFVLLADTSSRLPVIIDGGGTDLLFNITWGQDATTIISGFTIQNGYAQGGAAMNIMSSSPTIENCTFLNNHAYSSGGAITTFASSSIIRDCVFRGNSAENRGGAIHSTGASSMMITGCLFVENVMPTDWTRGGAMFLEEGAESVVECTIVGNTPDNIMVYNGNGVDVANCIIADATHGVGVTASPATGAWVYKSILFGNAGGDTPASNHENIIYHDPLFCDDLVDDYTLCDDSFAVHYNNMWNEQIGAYESGCEPCGTPVEPATWGAVKALFR